MLSINTNLNAQNASTQITNSQNEVNKSSERLTTGLRINTAADDVAGMGLATRLAKASSQTNQYIENASNGISLIQTADAALEQQQNLLARMQELAYKAENGTNTTDDTALIQKEFEQLAKELVRNEKGSEFNGKKLLDGTLDTSITIGEGSANQIGVEISNNNVISGTQVPAGGIDVGTNGALTVDSVTITIDKTGMSGTPAGAEATAEEIVAAINAGLQTAANDPANAAKADALAGVSAKVVDGAVVIESEQKLAIAGSLATELGVAGTGTTAREDIISDNGTVQIALSGHADGDAWKAEVHDKLQNLADAFNDQRADLGAAQNRLEYTTENLQSYKQNIDSTLSKTQDADYATETTNLAKANVLKSASQSMLSQANKDLEDVVSKLLQ